MDEVKEKMYEEYLNSQLDLIISTIPVDKKEENNRYTRVYKDGKENWMLENGKLLSEEFYDVIYADSINGLYGIFLVYEKDKGFNYINQDGKLLSKKWFPNANDFNFNFETGYIYATVENAKGKEKEINPQMKRFNKHKSLYKYDYKNDFISKKLRKNIRQTITHGTKRFHLKRYPHEIFGYGRYILCTTLQHPIKSFDSYSIYDTVSKKYIELSDEFGAKDFSHISTDYNSDIIYFDDIAIFMYDGKPYNISNYLDNHNVKTSSAYQVSLKKDEFDKRGGNLSRIFVKYGIKLLDKTEFELLNQDKINEVAKKAAEEAKRLEEEKNKRMEIEQIIIAQNSDIEKQKQLEEDKQKALDQLKNISEKLASLENVNLENNRVNIENIFSVVNDHKVIMDVYKSLLPNIDISMMSFKNVDVSGIDFSNTNLNTTLFNPQEVYQRNISGCDFTGLYFSPFSFNLSNVDVRGTSFSSGPNDENTIPNFENALYDETTTYNGVPITEIIKQEETEVEGPIYK